MPKCIVHTDSKNNLLSRAIIQYHFSGREHSVAVQSHGNSKKKTSYVRTLPSMLDLLDTANAQQCQPLSATVSHVYVQGINVGVCQEGVPDYMIVIADDRTLDNLVHFVPIQKLHRYYQ